MFRFVFKNHEDWDDKKKKRAVLLHCITFYAPLKVYCKFYGQFHSIAQYISNIFEFYRRFVKEFIDTHIKQLLSFSLLPFINLFEIKEKL